MKYRKMVAFGLTAVMAAGMTSGMTMTGFAEEDKPTIRWVSQGVGETGWEGLTVPILEKFEEETGIHVEAEFYSFNDLFEVIETKCASGNADFDVMSVDVTYVSKYGSSGYLEPLDPYFTDEDKAKWDEASYTAGVWEDTMYAAPENTSCQELYYNKTLLEEAGIELPENDAEHRLTYEQVADMAKQAQEALDPDGSKGIIGLDFQQVSRIYQMNMLPNSMGGANISEDGYSLDGVVNTEPWIKAMTWYQGLVNDGIASRGYDADQLGDMFYSGKMVFMVGGTWTRNGMTCDDEIDCTYAPCFEGYEDKVATSTGSWYFGINSQSENKDAAAEFIKYFTLGEGSDMWLSINGDVPSRLDKQEEIANDENATKDMKIAAYEAANTAYPRAVTPVFGEYSTILDQAWEDVRNGADVEDTLNYAVEQFDSAVASYKQ
ncbi:MAG: extracellular solute-binding protein [Lachnospiraceae bacterium]|nr:extracellular solute-binding protein [Lachnospiraceae bacterium]